jgi:hypothetical protein
MNRNREKEKRTERTGHTIATLYVALSGKGRVIAAT